MVEYETAAEARITHPHVMFQGAYWCPDAALPIHGGGSGVRYAVEIKNWRYVCPTCGEPVSIPTCGGEGQ